MTGTAAVPVLRVQGAPAAALDAATLRSIPPAGLAQWIAARRWFGAKGRPPAEARFAEIVPVALGDVRAVVARVVLEAGGVSGWQLPLTVRDAAVDPGAWPPSDAPLAVVRGESADGHLVDAMESPGLRAALGDALARGAAGEGDGARWTVEPVGDGEPGLGALVTRVSRAEQSNTSVVFGDRAIFKLFRRLEPGENPDVEITRFLTTRTAFRNAPALLGAAYYQRRDGERCVAGMLSRFVPGAIDGWAVACDAVTAYLHAPDEGNPPVPFVREGAELGAVTRALHDALASHPDVPGFETAPVTAADVERWTGAAQDMMEEAMTLLAERAGALDAATKPMARAIAGRRAAARERIAALAAAARGKLFAGDEPAPAARRSRHHGDYHLGQVLRGADGAWMIVDFEGEPARPLAERRALASPLRDVAGMLRSFAYAAATAGAVAHAPDAVDTRVEVRTARWAHAVRAAFLDAYGAADDDPVIALFETEKVFYELAYELNNRPSWAWIPLRGVARIF